MGDLPLRPGQRGEAIRDLQRRLAAAGHRDAVSEAGTYGHATESAVGAFQADRGLQVSGVCDEATWAALVEAGYQLGDRLLYLRAPMLRGDDVGELQRRLGDLGFDAGRVDAIFGPLTEQALKDFERNAGLTTDGVCGPDVLHQLGRVGPREAGSSIASIRERERLLQAPRALHGRRVAVADAGGSTDVADGLCDALRRAEADVALVHQQDPSRQADEANGFDADVFVGIAGLEHGPCWVAYYSTAGFESGGGRRLAELVVTMLRRHEGLDVEPAKGMRLPVLRETRMPAVLCSVGPPDVVASDAAALARGLARALAQWAAAPVHPEVADR